MLPAIRFHIKNVERLIQIFNLASKLQIKTSDVVGGSSLRRVKTIWSEDSLTIQGYNRDLVFSFKLLASNAGLKLIDFKDKEIDIFLPADSMKEYLQITGSADFNATPLGVEIELPKSSARIKAVGESLSFREEAKVPFASVCSVNVSNLVAALDMMVFLGSEVSLVFSDGRLLLASYLGNGVAACRVSLPVKDCKTVSFVISSTALREVLQIATLTGLDELIVEQDGMYQTRFRDADKTVSATVTHLSVPVRAMENLARARKDRETMKAVGFDAQAEKLIRRVKRLLPSDQLSMILILQKGDKRVYYARETELFETSEVVDISDQPEFFMMANPDHLNRFLSISKTQFNLSYNIGERADGEAWALFGFSQNSVFELDLGIALMLLEGDAFQSRRAIVEEILAREHGG